MISNLFRRATLIAMFAISVTSPVCADEAVAPEAEAGHGLSGELRLVSMQSRDKRVQQSLFTKELYVEAALAEGVSAFGIVYHDREFESASLGLARQLGDFQIGVGVGKARYDGTSHLVVNPWLYYQSDNYTGLLTADHYSNETDSPWYYHGYIERRLIDRNLVGLYGDKDVGAGPMVGMYVGGRAKVWVSVPMIYQPSQGGMRSLLGLTFEF